MWQLEWKKKPKYEYINKAKSFLKTYSDSDELSLIAIKDENSKGYFLDNVVIAFTSERAVVFKVDYLVSLMHTIYPIYFSIPNSNILEYESQRSGDPQKIKITQWAYNNCLMKSVNWILADFGKYIMGHFNMMEHSAGYKYSPYYDIIEEIKGNKKKFIDKKNKKSEINENNSIEKKKRENILVKNSVHNKPLAFETNDERILCREKTQQVIQNNSKVGDNIPQDGCKNELIKEVLQLEEQNNEIIETFFSDGSGNLVNGTKTKGKGHYSVYRVAKPPEKWKTKENSITSNQAEIKGVMAALYISLKRNYKTVLVNTDSQNVIKWLHGRDFNFKTNIEKIKRNTWQTRDHIITKLIDKLILIGDRIPDVTINWVTRTKNFAHSI